METNGGEVRLSAPGLTRARAILLALAMVAALFTSYAAGRLGVAADRAPVASSASTIQAQAPATGTAVAIRPSHRHRYVKWVPNQAASD
jgi:hypothetical protein